MTPSRGLLALAALLTFKGVVSQVVPEYKGCFSEGKRGDRFSLSGFQSTYRHLTIEQCNTLCFIKGFLYAATKNGRECICGDVEDGFPPVANETLCNVPCWADVSAKCGGKKAFSVYATGIKEDADLEELEIGCLTDGADIRLIKQHKVDLPLTNTPQRCVAYCKALGYRHAGVQYSFECYCGEADRLTPIVSGCDLPCVGDEDLTCGGNWKMNVYSTGITKPTPGVSPRGCYKYVESVVNLRKTIEDMDPNRCVAFCVQNLFATASVYNGTECLCGHKGPPSNQRAKKTECNIICPGKVSETCGGSNFVNSYNTGSIGNPLLGKLLGCFKDQSNDILSGPKFSLGVDNSATVCIPMCIEKGFAFAGLKNTYECHCGNNAPKRTPVRIVPDHECFLPCHSKQTEACGAPFYIALYRTGLDQASTEDCIKSVTKVNGKEVCAGKLLLNENFNKLDPKYWQPSIKMSGEDIEFVTYSNKTQNLFVRNGKLVIKPTLVDDETVRTGNIQLQGCTSTKASECSRKAKSYNILPPIESAQVCSKGSFNFRFGIITVRAKFPKGDWMLPQIWLKPVQEVYGPQYMSGKMVVAQARGNENLLGPDGREIGSSLLETGFEVSKYAKKKIIEKMTLTSGATPWYDSFHNYSIVWTADTILFYLDGNVLAVKTMYTYLDRKLVEEMGFYAKDLDIWKKGTVVAPFDEEFYICLGVTVGGSTSFPDKSVSKGTVKPWENYKVKGMLKFWLDKRNWYSTWSETESEFEIDHISITAY